MSENNQEQVDFLGQYVNTLFDQEGFAEMTEETRKQMIPQFMAEAERRIGIAVLPELSEESAKEFVKLAEDEDVTPEKINAFLQENVPNFKEVVQKTLKDFTVEFKEIMKGLNK